MLNDSGLEIESKYLKDFIFESQITLDILRAALGNFSRTDDVKEFEHFPVKLTGLSELTYKLSLNELGTLFSIGKDLSVITKNLTDKNQLYTVHSLFSQLLKILDKSLKAFRKDHNLGTDEVKVMIKKLKISLGQLEKHK